MIPAAEAAIAESKNHRVGVIATSSTIGSLAFERELKKLSPAVEVFQQPAPLLVPLIENDGLKWIGPILDEYLQPLLDSKIDTLILGSTHYPYLKRQIREKVGPNVKVISQDELLPQKLGDHLGRHREIEEKLAKNGSKRFLVTDLTANIEQLATMLFDDKVELELVHL